MSKCVVSKKVGVACVFCGYQHNYNDKVCYDSFKHLESMQECMAFEECPKFEEYPINQLRFIAFHYAKYRKAIPDFSYNYSGGQGKLYNREFGYDPIPLTLSKNRMVKALVDRWHGFATFRNKKTLYSMKEYEDCPICMEHFICHKWCNHYARLALHSERNGAILTSCKHKFCGQCWGNLLQKHVREVGYVNHEWISTLCLHCPMCRTQIKYPNYSRGQLDSIGQQMIDGNFHGIGKDISGR